MKSRDCTLIITGCMFPEQEVPLLKLKNSKIRREQYLESIKYYIDSSRFQNIVYCDNSNPLCEKTLVEYAAIKGKKLEWLSFQGDSSKVINKGKGYGEGEIIDYALKHSDLLKKTKYFCKITGRLIVENIDFLLRVAKTKYCYFQPVENEEGMPYISTKLYFISIDEYNRLFRYAYRLVDDRNGFYLEHSFGEVIKNKDCKYRVFLIYPDYRGESGSTGKNYKLTKIRLIKETIKIHTVKI